LPSFTLSNDVSEDLATIICRRTTTSNYHYHAIAAITCHHHPHSPSMIMPSNANGLATY